MKTHRILFEHRSEAAWEPRLPAGLLEASKVDMTEHVLRRSAIDSSGEVSIPRFEVRDVTLPDWLSPAEWAAHLGAWTWTFVMGADMAWPERHLRAIAGLKDLATRAAVVKLLTAKSLKSGFKASLREQFLTWADDPSPRYAEPFSRKQLQYLVDKGSVLYLRSCERDMSTQRGRELAYGVPVHLVG